MTSKVLLLGTPGVDRGNGFEPWPAERRFQLLAFLACLHDWIDRERLAALFWPEQASEAAFSNVRKAIHRAREIGWLDGFEASGTRVRWPVATDLAQFDAAVARGEHAAALRLYRGPLLAGLERGAAAPYLAWLRAERERRAQARRQAALAAIGAAADAQARLALAQALLADDPLDEDALVAAVQAQRLLGAPAEASRLLRAHAERLAADLGVEPSARLRALSAASAESGAVRAASAHDFVGRRLELRRLGERLHAAEAPRLLLLHGPGGVGKSRLAREVLRAHAAAFADGAHWAALDDLADVAQVPPRIAQVMGLQWRDAADGARQIAGLIGARHALLVLDNAEHLPALGALAAVLLEHCPRLRLLATSRALLAGAAAETLALEGLALPDEASGDAEAAAAFDAVRLFAERAAFHLPSFALAAQVQAVIDIVRQVQGLPLAIEMAAAWVRLLPPQEIARELRQSIDLLARDADAAALGRAEHASIRAAIERSWALLAPAEREVMAGLSVFVGGFTREAAQAVAGATMPLLAALVDKSLVQADRERARFDLHPLVAAFVREHASAHAAAMAGAQSQHTQYFSSWLARTAEMTATGTSDFRNRVDHDLENCRQAWGAACAARDAEPLARMALPLADYLRMSGRYEEGARLLAQARTLPDDTATARRALAHVYRMIASMYWNSGRQEGVRELARLGIRYARSVRDQPTVKSCLCTIGLALEARNRPRAALRYYRIALRIAESDRDPHWIAVACTNIAGVALQTGQHDESLRYNLRALQLHRELDNLKAVVKDLNNVGNHYRVIRDWARAERHFVEGLGLAERHGMNVDLAYLLVNMGLVEQERGGYDAAMRLFERAVALRDRGANPWLVAEATYGLARVAARCGDAATAHRHLCDGVRLARAIDHEHYLVEGVIVYAEVVAAAGDPQRARRLCGVVIADPRADATLRDDAQQVLARLGTAGEPAVEAAASVARIEDVIDEITRGAQL